MNTVLAGAGCKSHLINGISSHADPNGAASCRWQVYQIVQLFSRHLVDGQHELL